MENNPEKKYFVIDRKVIAIIAAIIYLFFEIGIVIASIVKAYQGEWSSAIWFFMAAAGSRFYYTLQTKKPQ